LSGQSMLRLFRECDLFRKLPLENRETEQREPGHVVVLQVASLVVIALLSFSELATFARPIDRQRFSLDMGESVDLSIPRKIRVLLNVTVHDFPCIDLSLDYQDVMGSRAVDVRTTIFKQRLHSNGTVVGDTVKNEPKPGLQGAALNPSVHGNATGNKTCGNCYGALPDGECCNTCSDVLYAYRLKRWALPRIEDIEQCRQGRQGGNSKLAYQPPQIIRLDDYVADDYLPRFSKLSSSEARITTPFKLNLSLEPLKLAASRPIQPLVFNFSALSGASSNLDEEGSEDEEEGEEEEDSAANSSRKVKPWPDCIKRNLVIHGYTIGEALMVDLTPYGVKDGCWNNDCAETDKFNSDSVDRCASVCKQVASCRWWSWGQEDGASRCWIRAGRHSKGKRYGFSSGSSACFPPENQTANQTQVDSNTSKGGGLQGETQVRRLASFEDELDGFATRPLTLNFGSSLHMPLFGFNSKENELRKQQRGESCRIHGYFDTMKVPGNFHIGSHGAMTPSYITYFDEPAPPTQNMRHTINSLAFVDPGSGELLNSSQPLDGFESPKAFTFQYYLTISPATVTFRNQKKMEGYQFRAGSFVTNELIGPAVFFRLDIDAIRVTYYTEEARFSKFLVNICAIVGGCIAVMSMLSQLLESAVACANGKD